MKKIKILLLEDLMDDVKQLTDILPPNNFEIAGIASNLKEGIALYETLDFDIVIIDIFLQGQPKGIDFARSIQNSDIKKPFIFLTSSIDKDVFIQAKTTDPSNYLIKPFNTPELLFAIELAIEKFLHVEGAFASQKPVFYNDSFFVKDGQSLVKVIPDDIKYITVDGPYCNMVAEKGTYILQISLSKFIEELPEGQFLRTHRNFIVNSKMIEKIYPNDNLIVIKSKEKVLLSRRYKEAFFKNYRVFK